MKGACGNGRIAENHKGDGYPFCIRPFRRGGIARTAVYLLPHSGANNFAADGVAYYKINEVRLEVYTDQKDLTVEENVECVLDAHSVFYGKSETWIDSEKLYEVLYQFEMEGMK